MAFEIKWVLLAEAIAQNSDGVLSAIGIGQNVVIAQALPAKSRRALVVRVESDQAGLPGAQIAVEFSVVAPSGETIVAHDIQGPIDEPRFPEFPWSAHIPVEMNLVHTEFGTHVVRVVVAISGEEHTASLALHVLRAEDVLPSLVGGGQEPTTLAPVEGAGPEARGPADPPRGAAT